MPRIWIVERSTDLDSYIELARIVDGEVTLPEPTFAVTIELKEGGFSLIDQGAPAKEAFYRFLLQFR